ncbi:SDR family NAD(P)-dependent oxidoreductase [Rhodococcus sp. JVH1]|uniref:SDR family NAD(P)-dependent oxidoreductase n=1 Tax=Rhodococcus sp. JVH1 TaxID=745408 RepID=UPI00027212B2|nr:SDR family NAD(P)-dependent oxidoreductase [Rhodococcus sp. JVH1]EJI98394.1 3-oxoacyl-[acyl-carrier-protein] reductase [Rhodococcus sp. JVH1]
MTNPESRIRNRHRVGSRHRRAIAERLIADGNDVILLDLAAHVHQTAEEIKAVGALQIDVRDVESLQAGIRSIAREQGRLDILVNCAGTCGRESFETLSPQTWHQGLDT